MTKKDLFKIVVKILGLYLAILTIFNFIPTSLSYASTMFQLEQFIYPILISLFFVFVAIGIFSLIIYNADSIVKFLKLDKGFDDDFIKLGNIDNSGIMKIAVILIGGLLIVENIPIFLSYVFQAFKSSAKVDIYEYYKLNNTDYFGWMVSGLSLLIGYLLMTNFKSISKFLMKKD